MCGSKSSPHKLYLTMRNNCCTLEKRYPSFFAVILFALIFQSCSLIDIDSPAIFQGKITDTSGKALDSVEVTINKSSGSEKIYTDINGQFRTTLNGGGVIVMVFSKKEYQLTRNSKALESGQNVNMNFVLRKISEDAFLHVNPDFIKVLNTNQSIKIKINSNTLVSCKTDASWIHLNNFADSLYVDIDANETFERKTGHILVEGEYNLKDTITISQNAGPLLLAVFRSDTLAFPDKFNSPHITYNKEIEVVSISHGIQYDLSADKKTIYLKNLKISLFNHLNIYITVKDEDEIMLSNILNFKLYEKSSTNLINFTYSNEAVFSADNQYLWIKSNNFDWEISQYNTKKLQQTGLKAYSKFKFDINPYDNLIYYPANEYLLLGFCTMNVADGNIIRPSIKASNNKTDDVPVFAFLNNGVALITDKINNGQIVDTKNKFKQLGTFQLNQDDKANGFLPASVQTVNQGKNIVLHYLNAAKNITAYNYNDDTRKITKFYSEVSFDTYHCSRFSPYVFYKSGNTLKKVNILSGEQQTFNTSGIAYSRIVTLSDDQQRPYILLSNMTLIKPDGSFLAFEFGKDLTYNVLASSDGKFLLIAYNNLVYYFDVRIFTNFSELIN